MNHLREAWRQRIAVRFSPSLVASWSQTKPWDASRQELEFQNIPGIMVGNARGTETASFEGGHIVVKEQWFDLPSPTRRAVLYHEAGHGLEQMCSVSDYKAVGVDDPLDIIDLPGARSFGHSYSEIVAEAYSVLWTEPGWFNVKGAERLKGLVIDLARKKGFPVPPNQRTAVRTTFTLYHGTNTMAAQRISYEGLKALDARDFAHQVEREFDLPPDSVWQHPITSFSRTTRLADSYIYLSGQRQTAEIYARNMGSEMLSDALRAVYAISHPEKDQAGAYDYADKGLQAFLADQQHRFRPALVTVEVARSYLYDEMKRQSPYMLADFDEFFEIYEESPPPTVMLPSPIPASWVKRVEVL